MKQRNPFRFVALRGIDITKKPNIPRATYEPSDSRPVPSSVPIEVNDLPLITSIRELLEQDQPVDEARRRSASEFMKSQDYVFRSQDWKPFLKLRDNIATLINETQTKKTHNKFAKALESLFCQRVNSRFSLDTFLSGDDYSKMRAQIWQSYYAHIIMRTVRPQEGPLLAFWIRVFEIFEWLKNEREPENFIYRFNEIKPAIPVLVSGLKQKREQSKPAEDENNVELIAREARFRSASINHDQLHNIYAKLKRRLREKLAVKIQSEAVLAQQFVTEETDKPKQKSAEPQIISDPWIFDETDLTIKERQFLDRFNILLTRQSIQDILASIEQVISAQLSEMRNASTETVIVNVDGVFVRRKRRRLFTQIKDTSSTQKFREDNY